MHHFPFLDALVIICGAAVAVILVFQRLRIPPIIGLIATGILLGPTGFGVIAQDDMIAALSELGVVMLLFTIGLEFSLDDLRRLRHIVFVGGLLQITVSTAVIGVGAWYVAHWAGVPISWQAAVLVGMAMSLSSTAICTKILKERRELGLPHGRAVMGILIFQDIAVVPLMIVVSLLAPRQSLGAEDVLLRIGMLIGVSTVLIVGMRILLPRLVPFVTRVSAPEVLILGGLGLCFGAAWLTSIAGISMALGAFIAGVAIAGSEEGHAIGRVLEPMRDAFTSVFFVSVGLLLNVELSWLPANVLTALAVIVVNAVIVWMVFLGLRIPLRVALIAGIVLAEVGEFSFVLATAGMEYGVIGEASFQNMLVTIIITMIVTPALISAAPQLAEHATPFVKLVPWLRRMVSTVAPYVDEDSGGVTNDPTVVIIGAGVLGTNVARVLRSVGIPYRILELNGEGVAKLRAAGEPIVQGDLTERRALEVAGVPNAKAVVVAISDQTAMVQGLRAIRGLRPDVYLIARSRYAAHSAAMAEAGATLVVTEEHESSISVFVALLTKLDVSMDVIREQESLARMVR
jgi:CPA2 family monovalent cation:H+ antiporter-2